MWTEADCRSVGALSGGLENIIQITNCFTRVHVLVRDLERVDREGLKALPLVKGLLVRGGEVQLIVGAEAQQLSVLCNTYLPLAPATDAAR